jgi:hypothetical protein
MRRSNAAWWAIDQIDIDELRRDGVGVDAMRPFKTSSDRPVILATVFDNGRDGSCRPSKPSSRPTIRARCARRR